MTRFLIAAPASGSGKTTISLGIMAALARQGLTVAPFKVGPDFIDPGYHRLVTGRPSVNLDGWMCGESFVRETFCHHAAGADCAVVEGAMGLFDGLGASGAGSSAEVASILQLPVILVVDAKGQGGSVAALVQGFSRFEPGVRIAGVIFNNVGSDRHRQTLAEAVKRSCPGVAVVGGIPRDAALAIPSRHLGLVTAEDNPLPPAFLDRLAATVERHLDLELVVSLGADTGSGASPGVGRPAGRVSACRIAVARDTAFSFVYGDNLRLLEEAGAVIVPFSPLADRSLPDGIGGIYLPGGYPELFAPELAANTTMRQAVRDAVEADMPVYGECGGFIYLTEGLAGGEGKETTPFVGVFPVTARMLPKRKALGYREIECADGTILGPAGTTARGHEFHYSEMEEMPSAVARLYRVRKGGIDLGMEGYRYRNCLASYVHLHFGSNPVLAATFVERCRRYATGG